MGNKSSKRIRQQNGDFQNNSDKVLSDPPKPVLKSGGSAEMSHQTRFMPHIPQFPPLSVQKDAACQTKDSYLYTQSQPANYSRKLAFASFIFLALYVVLCSAFMCSSFLQSLLVYVHWARWPMMGELTDLNSFGLIEARNINITTEDKLILRGWHLISSNADILTLSQLRLDNSIIEINNFFDNSLASSKRQA